MNKRQKYLISIVAVFAIIMVAFVFMKNRATVEIKSKTTTTKLTTEIVASEVPSTSKIIDESTTISETTTEEPSVTETTTKRPVFPETTTKAPVETTTKPKPTETTTKKSDITFNGHKPYEVFTDPVSGEEVYYDEYGRLCCAETLTAVPQDSNDECPWCGEKNCGAFMESWYCIVCEKNIQAHECHPKSHLDASR